MTDPKEDLAAALALTGPAAALAVLRHAMAWAAASLPAEISEGNDVAALECVIGLDDVLAQLAGLLEVLPGIVAAASPGRAVEERIAERRAVLDRERSRLAAERSALAAAGDIERQLSQAEAERDQIQAQVNMLERQQQLAAELPAMRAVLDKLRTATDAATADSADEIAGGLVAVIRTLTDLTESQRDLLGPDLSRLTDEAASAGQALAAERQRCEDLRAETAGCLAEADRLRQEAEQVIPGLELCRQADQALADGLTVGAVPSAGSELERVRSELAAVTVMLTRLDDLLKPLLAEHARAYADALRIRNWSG